MSSKEIPSKILFNYKSKDYSFLSNYYVSEMTIDEKVYHHVEGFYQSTKYIKTDEKTAEHIRNIYLPHVAKSRGESKEFIITSDDIKKWNDSVRIINMKRALITKFITNSTLAKLLVKTGDAELVYSTEDDQYWGTNKDGKGMNMLGKMLMRVRDIMYDLPRVDHD